MDLEARTIFQFKLQNQSGQRLIRELTGLPARLETGREPPAHSVRDASRHDPKMIMVCAWNIYSFTFGFLLISHWAPTSHEFWSQSILIAWTYLALQFKILSHTWCVCAFWTCAREEWMWFHSQLAKLWGCVSGFICLWVSFVCGPQTKEQTAHVSLELLTHNSIFDWNETSIK